MNTSALSAPVTNTSAASTIPSTAALSNSLTNLEFSDLMQIWGDGSENSSSTTSAASSIMSSPTATSAASQPSGTAAPVPSPLPITSSTELVHDNHDTRNLSTSQAARDEAKYDLQLSNTSAYLRSLGQTLAADQVASVNVTAT